MTSTSSIPIPDLAATVPPSSTQPISKTHALPHPFNTTSPPPTLLTQGAEALVYKTTFLSDSSPAALKFRPSKPYRHPTLDARLTKQRVLAEARVLVKLSGLRSQGIVVPGVLGLEWDVGRKVKGLAEDVKMDAKRRRIMDQQEEEGGASAAAAGAGAWILMEWIDGKSVKELLREWDMWCKTLQNGVKNAAVEEEVRKLLRRVGRAVAVMHEKGGVVHGDLTSSNIMVRPSLNSGKQAVVEDPAERGPTNPPDLEGEIVLIDFGLAVQSVQEEDRAVDLYVLERAFGSTHPKQEGWFDEEVLQSRDGYRGTFKGANGILKRLEEVRMRGRKRTMIG